MEAKKKIMNCNKVKGKKLQIVVNRQTSNAWVVAVTATAISSTNDVKLTKFTKNVWECII